MNAEIIAIGSELLTPFRSDTNSLFLTARLNELGVEVILKTIVGDDRARLTEAVALAWKRSGLVITIGGLGPTEDDLTRECVAAVLGRALIRDDGIAEMITTRFRARGMTMPAINLRQAMVIAGAAILPNDRGTAPGLWIEHEGKFLILLPGPPREIEPMFAGHCLPRLRERLPRAVLRRRQLRLTGLTESAAEEIIAPIFTRYANPATTILAALGEIQVHLTSTAPSEADAEARLDELASQLEKALGDRVFSSDGSSLETVAGQLLAARGETLAVAESCTGGLLGERITSVAGSSSYFLGGVISYSNSLKQQFLGVTQDSLDQHGAVSEPVARQMAEAVRRSAGATHGLSITGVAGPGGATPGKPVGLVCIALASPGGTRAVSKRFAGERDSIRWQASQAALDLLRRTILGTA